MSWFRSPGEAEVDWQKSLFDNAVSEVEKDGYDPSHGILNNPDLENIIPNEPGTAIIYENNQEMFREIYDDTWRYLDEKMPEEEFSEVGAINPVSAGEYPTEIHLWSEMPEKSTFETDNGLEIDVGTALYVRVNFASSWDETRIFF